MEDPKTDADDSGGGDDGRLWRKRRATLAGTAGDPGGDGERELADHSGGDLVDDLVTPKTALRTTLRGRSSSFSLKYRRETGAIIWTLAGTVCWDMTRLAKSFVGDSAGMVDWRAPLA